MAFVTPAGWIGDVDEDDTIYFSFFTGNSTGVPTTLAGTPAISVYKDADDTETTTGVTLAVDDDARTGWHRVTLDLTDAFYTADTDYHVVITAGTVNADSVVGVVVAQFSIHKRAPSTICAAIQAQTDNLPSGIKKNTALSNFTFLMVDSTDGITAETGLTITSQRSIDGAAFGSTDNSAVELSNGIYVIDLSAADLNGDVVILRFSAAGALDTFHTIITEP